MKIVINPLGILRWIGIGILVTIGLTIYISTMTLVVQSWKYKGEISRKVEILDKRVDGSSHYLTVSEVGRKSQGELYVTKGWYDGAEIGDIDTSVLTYSQVISEGRNLLTGLSWVLHFILFCVVVYHSWDYVIDIFSDIGNWLNRDIEIDLSKKKKSKEIKESKIKEPKPPREGKIINKIKEYFVEEE